MKLVSYNIQYGFGADGRYDLERAASVVADADIIALQEVERNWRRTGNDDQPEILSRLLPDHYYVYGPAFDMDASTREAGRIVNRRRQFGTMLLSRLPIEWSRLHLLPMRRTVTPLNTQNPALECMIRTPYGPVRFFSLHLAHIGVEERLEQIDFLLERHRRVPSKAVRGAGSMTSRRATGRMASRSRKVRLPQSGWAISTPSREAPNTAASPATTRTIRARPILAASPTPSPRRGVGRATSTPM